MNTTVAQTQSGQIHLFVYIPSMLEPKEFDFAASETVGVAATTVAEQCGIQVSDPTFMNEAKQVLDRSLTLKASGLVSGARVELVDGGGGV